MIDIVYEDRDIIVLNKPSGLLCVPGLSSPDNLFDQVKQYNPNARTVHRLDMGTSGLVIFALNYNVQKIMSKLFENRKIHKTYYAKVYGQISASIGEIQSPMLCDWPNRPKQKIDWIEGKQAHTFFERITFTKNSSTIRLSPLTGRTHQLRLHMLQIGHPILGDPLYTINHSNQLAERLLLHASDLCFMHPTSNKTISISKQADFI